MQNRLSATGVTLRVDHDAVGATAESISAASEDVAFYCATRYLAADLPGNAWISSKAATVAIYYLCGFRNNPVPKTVQALYDKAIKELEAVQLGTANVPGLSIGKSFPQVVTQRIDYSQYPAKRLVENASTGNAEGFVEYTDRYRPRTTP